MSEIHFSYKEVQTALQGTGDIQLAEALVLVVDGQVTLPQLHPQLDSAIQAELSARDNGSELLVLPTMGFIPYSSIVIARCPEEGALAEGLRLTGVRVAKLALQRKWQSLHLHLAIPIQPQVKSSIYAVTEGIMLGQYQRRTYKLEQKQDARLSAVSYSAEFALDPSDLAQSIQIAQVYAEATNYARDLTNIPGNMLTPQGLAEQAVQLAEQTGLTIEVLDDEAIVNKGMHALYSVGKGSANKPRMIVLKYQGREQWDEVLGLVGKGITFDTGGISLKRAEGMDEMISDMGGAAVVLGVMKAIAAIKPKANVVAVIPSAENMPSSSAYKPGDVIHSLSGKTIEVLNTDAEGRIVLADGITYAKQLGATKLIDIATLTGAVMVALGDSATGAVTNDQNFYDSFLQMSNSIGERVWQLPVYPEYKEKLKSTVADLKNTGGRYAGTITGGLFIGAFAEDTPWIHLDIGGTAYLDRAQGIYPKGGTGVLVRTLAECISGEVTRL